MDKRGILSFCLFLPKRVGWFALLICLLFFIWTAPVWARVLIKVLPPSDLTASSESSNSIMLNWKDHSDNESGFSVEMSSDSGLAWEYYAKLPPDTTSYKCTGLNKETRYWFRVQALGNDDALATLISSDYSNVTSTKTLSAPDNPTSLKAPGELTATGVSKSCIRLSWKDTNYNESNYYIEKKIDNGVFAFIDSVPAGFVSYLDRSVSEGFTYTYRIMAKGDGVYTLDSGYSNEAVAATKTQSNSLKPPSNLAAVAVSSSGISLTWTDNATDEIGYSIERANEGGEFNIITRLPANATAYVDQALQDSTRYTYRVQALGASSKSDYSNSASAITAKEASDLAARLSFYIDNNAYYLNGRLCWMDTTPVILEGRTLLPVSYTAAALGITVNWDEAERKISLSRKGTVIEMWIDKSIARINGIDTNIDPGNPNVAPRIYEGRTMVPVSFVVSNFKCKVEWFTSNQEVRVTYPVPKNEQTRL